jgi:hypothetical protein
LDIYLDEMDKEAHCACEPFNRIETIKHVVVAYSENEAVGCDAIREYSSDTMEIKRTLKTLSSAKDFNPGVLHSLIQLVISIL